MSARDLGRLIDAAHAQGGFVRESAQAITVSNLSALQARDIANVCAALAWGCSLADGQGTVWEPEELDQALAPFRLVIAKPAINDTLLVLSLQGFGELVEDTSNRQKRWWVAGLGSPIRTWDTLFLPWGRDDEAPEPVSTKNPRFLVREYGSQRRVPDRVGRWLLRNPDDDRGVADGYREVWSEMATEALIRTLPNEIEIETEALKFRGPPRLSLTKPSKEEVKAFARQRAFDNLQHAASWVFESERDTETRHALLAAEIARSGVGSKSATEVVQQDIEVALEGARIAYEMSLAAVGADTLKALTELRKAVTEETSKVTEATRQTVTAVSGALAVGMGLIAAKLTSSANVLLIDGLMFVAVVYVGMVIASGWQFVRLQRNARQHWQPRLYQFLPKDEYQRLVRGPTGMAETAFKTAAWAGGAAVVVLAVVLLLVGNTQPSSVKKTNEGALHSS
ncbi:hypothetical protein FHT86_007019 [Rhizobium sp. BK313]|uniref:hypothetical protein n=1 Tax=Rhizobium sp. BK313 TaxID=2587081 RepID=UPI0010607075|nr:hypothetical protein [Rhizobium sp. BK313]MBB3458693.1 hypothetical protein [Rhizobium sp. BK313]